MLIKGFINYTVTVAKSGIHGKGLFAVENMPAKKKIGSLGGEIISKRKGRLKAKIKRSISLVELWNGETLDASVNSNELKFINHSCQPNTYMRTLNHHVEFYALRNILASEELTCNYGPTHHNGNKKCMCGAARCKGFI